MIRKRSDIKHQDVQDNIDHFNQQPRLFTSGSKQPTNNSSQKRSLVFIPLSPPDYIVNDKVLLDGYIELAVNYAGTLSDIPSSINMSHRAELLFFVDQGYNTGLFSSSESSSIISISAQNVKISHRMPPENVQLRISMSDLDSAVYIRDDYGHLVLLLHSSTYYVPSQSATNSLPKRFSGTASSSRQFSSFHESAPSTSPPMCLTLLSCDSRICAEEICAVIRQCFQLVYTEATMQFLDSQLQDTSTVVSEEAPARRHLSDQSLTVDTDSVISSRRREPLTVIPPVDIHTTSYPTDMGSITPASSRSESQSNDTDSSELLKNYMREMSSLCSAEERNQFAIIFHAWQQSGIISALCRQLLQLFTVNRIHLLAGIRPFILSSDRPYLDEFIAQHSTDKFPSTRYMRSESSGSTMNFSRSVSMASSAESPLHEPKSTTAPPAFKGRPNKAQSEASVPASSYGAALPDNFQQRFTAVVQEVNGLDSLITSELHRPRK